MHSQLAVAPPSAQAGAPSIFADIETQLLHSEVYQQVLANLQALAGDAADTAQSLLASLGKEAARLAFQTISQHYKVVPGHLKQTTGRSARPAPPPRRLQTAAPPVQATAETEAAASDRDPTDSVARSTADQPTPKTPKTTWRFRRMSQAERAQLLAQERETVCRQIGETLRRARETQGISIGQLYSQTFVQVFYIKAIESGRIEQLPEDIYLRGFIRRLGNALGLDGSALAKSLPRQSNDTIVPSWYSPEMKNAHKSIGGVTPVHMYAGYTAAMAAAIGGLGLLTSPQQPSYAQPEVEPDAAQAMPSFQDVETTTDIGEQASAAIAPPEAL